MEDKIHNLKEIQTIEGQMPTGDGEKIYIKKWMPSKPLKDNDENNQNYINEKNQIDKKEEQIIVQIAHGMAEHINRYEDFANRLSQEGWILIGNDHRGHGKTAKKEEDLGYFAADDGWNKLVQDMKQITKKIKIEYPNSKVLLLGHSMGSFLARRYVQVFPNIVDGLILSGTGYSQGFMSKVGIELAAWEKKRKGPKKRSELLNKLIFGSYNERVSPIITQYDWLSRDEEVVQAYLEDPLSGFVFTWGGFYDLISGIELIHKDKEIKKTPKNLPLYMFSGSEDPVGLYGIGVEKAYQLYKDIGMENIELKIYEGGRHEMLNETNKNQVYEDIIKWIKTNF